MTDQEVVDFASRFTPPEIPGVPKLSANNIIDGGRTMTFYHQIPTNSSGRRFELRSRIVGVYDKGKMGSIVENEQILVDAVSGEEYVKIVGNTFYMGQGNWKGPKGEIFTAETHRFMTILTFQKAPPQRTILLLKESRISPIASRQPLKLL